MPSGCCLPSTVTRHRGAGGRSSWQVLLSRGAPGRGPRTPRGGRRGGDRPRRDDGQREPCGRTHSLVRPAVQRLPSPRSPGAPLRPGDGACDRPAKRFEAAARPRGRSSRGGRRLVAGKGHRRASTRSRSRSGLVRLVPAARPERSFVGGQNWHASPSTLRREAPASWTASPQHGAGERRGVWPGHVRPPGRPRMAGSDARPRRLRAVGRRERRAAHCPRGHPRGRCRHGARRRGRRPGWLPIGRRPAQRAE